MRSVHNAHVQQVVGDTHLAKALLQYGLQSPSVVQSILQGVKRLKEEARSSGRSGGAGEPAEDRASRKAALGVRLRFRQGRRLYRYVAERWWRWDSLTSEQQNLYHDFKSGELARAVDKANLIYGHGVARSRAYGYEIGDDMGASVLPIAQRATADMNLQQSCRV